MGKESEKVYMYICVCIYVYTHTHTHTHMNHFAVTLKLIQHCKSTAILIKLFFLKKEPTREHKKTCTK